MQRGRYPILKNRIESKYTTGNNKLFPWYNL